MYSVYVLWFFTIGVSSFGNPRIEAYLQLPAAYRSLSRPSSAPDAKAFTLCSCSLELPSFKSTSRPTLFSRSYLNCLSFIQNMDNCFFAAIRFSFLLCFASPHWFLSVWQNCFFTLWLERPDLSFSFENKIRLCPLYLFFHTQFLLYSIFNEHEALASWTPTPVLADVWLSSSPFRSGWRKWIRTTDLTIISRVL